MLHATRRLTFLASLLLAIAVGASAATAAGKVKFTLKGTTKGLSIQGKIVSGSLGTGTYKGTIVNNATGAIVHMKLSGGTLKMIETAHISGSTLSGTWRIASGTGRFKSYRARGKFSGSLVTGVYRFAGVRK